MDNENRPFETATVKRLTPSAVRHFASRIGINVVAFASAEPFEEFREALAERARYYAEDRGAPRGTRTRLQALRRRIEPAAQTPNAETIIIVGVYNNDDASGPSSSHPEPYGRIAKRFNYFRIVERAATDLVDFLRRNGYTAVIAEDRVPIKPALVRSGLGRFGKNTLVYVNNYGSWVDWVPILTDADLAETHGGPANVSHPRCRTCRACIEACPSGALYAPFNLDPDRCVSSINRYEHDVTIEARSWLGTWICGCDICQEACPINRETEPRTRPLEARPETYGGFTLPQGIDPYPALMPLLSLKEPEYTSLRRNVIIVLGNLRSTQALPELRLIASDPSSSLKGYAEWAIEAIRR